MTLLRMPSSVSGATADVRAAIGQAAQTTGVNFSYLMAQAKSESGLNPNAKAASSSASGLFQFIDQSWLGVVKAHGAEHGLGWAADAITAKKGGGFTVDPNMRQAVFALRQQAGPSALMAASYASDNASSLSQTLGRDVNGTDLYMAHFLGLGGATKFLRAQCTNGQACAANMFPQEARANRSIFYGKDGSARSLDDVYAIMGHKLDNAVDGSNDATIQANASGLTPGSLVPSLPGAPDLSQTQLAFGDMATADTDSADGNTDQGGMDISQMLASIEQSRVNMLKPTPAQAKLAYLMLSMPTASS
ncbi:MAG TPA: transglycosylase SLT domain-containing protein [Sphingomonas sp.]|uniref:transglycosylase SLT domain-containing protein n=1 Tax=Sphingomonas sp. TaxID=28214 RepID=UPI002D064380|nr:transglycosylase SLT domain-containing protein [Sphingomonas sp.]HMI18857.1 transglycosylase SLT domain-containing protein [Sphingomonas sp.]